MTYKVHRIPMLAFIEILFKRQDYIHGIYVPFNGFDAVFFPSPYLWGDVIMSRNSSLFSPLGNAHIKTRVIYEDKHIGLKLCNISFAKVNIAENCSEIGYYLPKTHKGQIAVVLHELSSYSFHTITSPKAKLRLRVYLL